MEEWGGRPRLRLRDLELFTTAFTVAANPPSGDAAAFASSKRRRVESRAGTRARDGLLQLSRVPWVIIGKIQLWNDGFCCQSLSGHPGDCFAIADDTGAGCCLLLRNVDQSVLGSRAVITSFNYVPAPRKLKIKRSNENYVAVCVEVHEIQILETSPSIEIFPKLCLSPVLADVKNEMIETPPSKRNRRRDLGKARLTIWGCLHCISPSFSLPCSGSAKDLFASEEKIDEQVLKGFLVELKSCRQPLEQRTKNSKREEDEGGEAIRVYFSGALSAWRPVLLNYIGCWISVAGLRRKIISVGPKDDHLVMAATRSTLVSPVAAARALRLKRCEKGIGSYIGVVTKVEFEGRMIELDDGDVSLLLTHQEHTALHGLRVGAMVLAHNVHITVVYWGWRKCTLLGACFRSTVKIASFSPLCSNGISPVYANTMSLKKIQRLSFSETFGFLKTVLDLRMKLGNESGVCDHVRSSSMRIPRDGVKEFVSHRQSCCLGERGTMKRTPPFWELQEHLRRHCWTSSSLFVWRNKEYACSNRCIVPSEDMDFAILGRLEVSRTSGTLQLSDATHKIDVVIPDLHSSLMLDQVYKVSKFTLIVEGSRDACRFYFVFSSADAQCCQSLKPRSISNLSPLPDRARLRGRIVGIPKLILIRLNNDCFSDFLSNISVSFASFVLDDGSVLSECWAYGKLGDQILGLRSRRQIDLLRDHDRIVYERDLQRSFSQSYQVEGDRRSRLSQSDHGILDGLATRACQRSPVVLACDVLPGEFGNKTAIVVRAVEEYSYVREAEILIREIERGLVQTRKRTK